MLKFYRAMQELSAARGANHNAQLAHLKNTEKKTIGH